MMLVCTKLRDNITVMRSRKTVSKPASAVAATDFESRLAALEAQVAALAAQPVSTPERESAPDDGVQAARDSQSGAPDLPKRGVLPQRKFWAIDGVLRNAEAAENEAGGVVFAGQVVLPNQETYAWQMETDARELLAADWTVANAALAALAHPIRLQVLKALIEGKRDTQSLVSLPDMGTTGQLYHHLKELEAASWIRQPRRGEYIVLAERVIPLLAILSACEVTQR
jgi:DNA-binding transcriptional ArsR family regulator